MFFGLTIEKLLLIGVIAALVVGPERLPRYAESSGQLHQARPRVDVAPRRRRVKDEMGDGLRRRRLAHARPAPVRSAPHHPRGTARRRAGAARAAASARRGGDRGASRAAARDSFTAARSAAVRRRSDLTRRAQLGRSGSDRPASPRGAAAMPIGQALDRDGGGVIGVGDDGGDAGIRVRTQRRAERYRRQQRHVAGVAARARRRPRRRRPSRTGRASSRRAASSRPCSRRRPTTRWPVWRATRPLRTATSDAAACGVVTTSDLGVGQQLARPRSRCRRSRAACRGAGRPGRRRRRR